MEIKKSNKANLENKRGIFLQIGFVFALSTALVAFEWATPESELKMLADYASVDYEEEIIPVTTPEKNRTKPEPPKPVFEINIMDNNELLEEDLNIISLEIDGKSTIEIPELPDEPDEPDPGIFVRVEQMPQFRNGGEEKFRQYVVSKLRFPPEAAEMNLSGRITVKFVIDENGNLTNTEIVRGIDPLLDNEVLKVINASPKWEPGKQRNIPVKVMFYFPIVFKLQ